MLRSLVQSLVLLHVRSINRYINTPLPLARRICRAGDCVTSPIIYLVWRHVERIENTERHGAQQKAAIRITRAQGNERKRGGSNLRSGVGLLITHTHTHLTPSQGV